MKRMLVILLNLLMTLSATAGTVDHVRITMLNINKDIPNVLFVQTEGTKTGGNPACHINSTWTFVLPLVDKNDQQILALLLAARASQGLVRIDGNGQCNVFGSIETATYVTY